MATARETKARITDAFVALSRALGSQEVLAHFIGMSRKTVERYTGGRHVPPAPKRPRIVARLVGHVDPTLIENLASALEVPMPTLPARTVEVPVDVGLHLELTVLLSAERNGVSPAAARQLALDVLRRVTELRVDAASAQNLLAATVAMRAASTVPG